MPGMVAAMTVLPVIGVPVKTSALSGVDSLYSIVQMPGGVPVATVAVLVVPPYTRKVIDHRKGNFRSRPDPAKNQEATKDHF